MTLGSKDTVVPESFWYMVNHGYLGSYIPASMNGQGLSSAGVVFVTAVMGSPATKSSPLDVWGNVKIPRIQRYEGTVPMDSEGWYETRGDDVDAYSSLIGIPIAGINQSNFINYVIRVQSPYLSLKCSMNTTVLETSILDKGLPEPSSNVSGSGSMIFWDVPDLHYKVNLTGKLRDEIQPEIASALRIKYVPLYPSNFTLDCNVTSTYVETEIRCPTLSACTASRIRRSKLDQFPSAWTLLDMSWRTLPLFFEGMLNTVSGQYRYPQSFDRYLSDPNLINSNYVNVTQTTEENYTIRLGQILNSYFACLNGFFAITAGINNETAYFWDNNQTFTIQPETQGRGLWETRYTSTMYNDTFKTKVWSSNGIKTERKEVIVAHRGWVLALCFASIALIVSSLASPIIYYFLTVGVDVAINISSLATRNNLHISLPDTGTYLDASDRARLLRDYKVRFGDAKGEASVGSLAIGSFGNAERLGVARVRKGRLYE
jgi:hypothetical protein